MLKLLNCEGYGFDIKINPEINIKRSDYIIIDALDYRQVNNKDQIINLYRDLIKSFTGFSLSKNELIATSHWGCGIFGGNKKTKFIIQLIACSLAKKRLIYCLKEQYEISEFKNLYNKIITEYKTIDELYKDILSYQ